MHHHQDVLSNDKMTFRAGKLQVSLSDRGNYKNHSALCATMCSHRWVRARRYQTTNLIL